jgi:pyruvate/2-oxoglutarate dehydrogenase complex dihydrolipoamide dehydrogenase (E3) component
VASKHYDIVVIGGGPAGYVGAIRAAQLGLKTACVERSKLGGVCLNWGCIPSKSLLANAELYENLQHAEDWGLKIPKVDVDWAKVISRSRGVADKLNKGVAFLLRKNKIDHIEGNAKITKGKRGSSPCEIEIHDAKVKDTLTHAPAEIDARARETITADHVLVCTGSVARDLPFARFDGDKIIGAREAMTLPKRPERLVVIGAGAIGMEFAYFYHTYGTKVTVVEMLDRILPVEDADVSKGLEKIYKKSGMDLRTSHTTTAVETTKSGVKVTIAPFKDGKADESKKETLEADKVLLAIGVKGRYDGLFDDALGVQTVRDHIQTDYDPTRMEPRALTYQTSVPGIYAVGDVIGPPVARARGVGGGDRLRRAHRRARPDPDRLLGHPRVHVLPPAGRLGGLHRARPEGEGPEEGRGLRGRDVQPPGARQGDRRRAQPGVREDPARAPAGRDPRGPHPRRPGDRADRRAHPRPAPRGDERGDQRHRPRAPDDARGDPRGLPRLGGTPHPRVRRAPREVLAHTAASASSPPGAPLTQQGRLDHD